MRKNPRYRAERGKVVAAWKRRGFTYEQVGRLLAAWKLALRRDPAYVLPKGVLDGTWDGIGRINPQTGDIV